jgi:hypothetical protein
MNIATICIRCVRFQVHLKPFTLLFLLLSCVTSNAQIRHKNTGSLKVLGLDTLDVDANNGDVVEALFAVKNYGSEPMTISQIATECICMEYFFPEKAIAPGSIDTVRLFFKTKNVPPGDYFKRVYVDYDEGSIELMLRGHIQVIRPVYRQGERPIIYKPQQIVRRNEVKN